MDLEQGNGDIKGTLPPDQQSELDKMYAGCDSGGNFHMTIWKLTKMVKSPSRQRYV